MRLKRAATLAVTFEESGIAVHNFLTRNRFTCSAECLDFLSRLTDWCRAEDLFGFFPGSDRQSVAEEITRLVEFGALVVEGSPQAEADAHYCREWQWGAATGFYHFSIRGTEFIVGKQAREFMRLRKAWRPSPPLFLRNEDRAAAIPLPRTDLSREPFALMHRRRSERKFTEEPITMQELADCLYCGNGIVSLHEDKDFGTLPIAMTPSGGARNPFELYVYANRVTGLDTGFYHYSAADHDLGLLRLGAVDVPAMLGSQRWPAGAAAIIFLVAYFPRTMWKYHMPISYRVVLMEAGFIAQNIVLAATHHGLSGVPSGAFDESQVEGYLQTPQIESAVILSVSVGTASGN